MHDIAKLVPLEVNEVAEYRNGLFQQIFRTFPKYFQRCPFSTVHFIVKFCLK